MDVFFLLDIWRCEGSKLILLVTCRLDGAFLFRFVIKATLQPGTPNNQFLMTVSTGWFQIITWKMVVSPFPSIKTWLLRVPGMACWSIRVWEIWCLNHFCLLGFCRLTSKICIPNHVVMSQHTFHLGRATIDSGQSHTSLASTWLKVK